MPTTDIQNPGVQFLLQRNVEQSKIFCSEQSRMWKRQYREAHPTKIIVLKCSDGRLNLSLLTDTPPGILEPYRTIGGAFDIGWPFFESLIMESVRQSASQHQNVLILVTYHWSVGDVKRGCRGFNNDIEAAKAYTRTFCGKLNMILAHLPHMVRAIQVGIETDEDALTFHGESSNGVFKTVEHLKQSDDEILEGFRKLYPALNEQMTVDLATLALGNRRHVEHVRKNPKPLDDVFHKERVVVIGRGADWLHLPNFALIIGPYSYNLSEPLIIAAKILLENLTSGRVPQDEGVVLMISAAYREADPHYIDMARGMAIEKAHSLSTFAYDTVAQHVPELMPYVHMLKGTVDMQTRLFTPLE
ncbi:MAG: hypothetical protein WC289_02035 [Patescibacteria group bacterium]|jgi:hypothetical protein